MTLHAKREKFSCPPLKFFLGFYFIKLTLKEILCILTVFLGCFGNYIELRCPPLGEGGGYGARPLPLYPPLTVLMFSGTWGGYIQGPSKRVPNETSIRGTQERRLGNQMFICIQYSTNTFD